MKENTGTVDFGIDLGTTTSSVAVVSGNDTIVIPNKIDNKNFLLSAVYIKKNGTIFVGDKAKNKIAIDPKNGYSEFKLRMGSNHVYNFENSHTQMTPVELSAEILKNLKQTVYESYEEDLKSAVITVPADFNTHQNRDTVSAAKLAGIEQVILLQEPTAAAMAYGFDSTEDNEIWLIYDLGGGTFDVSIMKKSSEEIVNVNNHGDSHLGGKLIDWDIVDKILVPEVIEQLGLTDFERNNPKYMKQFAKLKKAAETVKTDLSSYNTSEIEIENFYIKEDGDFFDFEYEMNRIQLDEIMKPYVDRTINHCKKALKDVDLSVSDVTKIILVGGSSLSPYIHERLKEEFNIPLEYSIDPTTVVARGAAIYAGTKTKNISIMEEEDTQDTVNVTVIYETMGDSFEFDVSGKVINKKASVEGYSIEFINNKTHYSSGKIPVNANGVFLTELVAEDDDDYNTYEIRVYDADGNIISLSPNSINTIKYKIQAAIGQHILSHTLGLGKYENLLDVIAEKGTPLPFEFEKTYVTSNYLHSGDSSEKFYMPLYEGNNKYADRNTLIAHLSIMGDEIERDLPEDSEIELTVNIDESMNISTVVYIPLLDQYFDLYYDREKYYYDNLADKFEKQKERYYDLLFKPIDAYEVEVTEYLNQIKEENMIENITSFLENSETDPDALDNANKRINDFTNILDHIDDILEENIRWNQTKSEVDGYMTSIKGDIPTARPEIQNLFHQLQDVYNQAVATKNEDLLLKVKQQLEAILVELHRKELVINYFIDLKNNGKFNNQKLADKLIEKGNEALDKDNMQELEQIIGQLDSIRKEDSTTTNVEQSTTVQVKDKPNQ